MNPEICEAFRTLGVRDSKKIADKRIRELAREIRMCYGHHVSSIEVTPLRYNAMYASFKKKGQNLNDLLGWLHVRAIKNLLNRVDCRHVLVDRFAKRGVLESQLQSLRPKIELVQAPKLRAMLLSRLHRLSPAMCFSGGWTNSLSSIKSNSPRAHQMSSMQESNLLSYTLKKPCVMLRSCIFGRRGMF